MTQYAALPFSESSSDKLHASLFSGVLADDLGDDHEASWGTAARRLTISFAPDGTDVLGQKSSLYDSFGDLLSADQLEARVLAAFQQWARHSNVNVGRVNDSGDPLGTIGRTQLDPRFGDIRIAAIPMAADVFAVSMNHDELLSGTWAGDIIFNSNAIINDAQQFSAVALHEAGHVLGLGHSDDSSSAMHRYGSTGGLTQEDIGNLVAIHGPRNLDLYDKTSEGENNNTLLEASEIKNPDKKAGSIPLVVYGDISDRNDRDFFRMDLQEEEMGPVTFALISDGISQLMPTLVIYDTKGNRLGQTSSKSSFGDTISVTLEPNGQSRLFARVAGAPHAGQNDFGSYSLAVTFDDRLGVDMTRVMAVARGDYAFMKQENVQGLFGGGVDDAATSDPDKPIKLELQSRFEARPAYHYDGTLTDAADYDLFEFKAGESAKTMRIKLRALQAGGMMPRVVVFDSDGNELVQQFVVNRGGELAVQVRGVEPDKGYSARVDTQPALGFVDGNYRFEVSFAADSIPIQQFASGTVRVANPAKHTLFVAESQMFHLTLGADGQVGDSQSVIWASIYDMYGNLVHRNATRPGMTMSAGNAMLAAGTYAVHIDLTPLAGDKADSLGAVTYHLQGTDVGGPTGPKLVDPSNRPIPRCQLHSDKYCYPDGTVTRSPYLFLDNAFDLIKTPSAPPVWRDLAVWYWTLHRMGNA